MITVRPQNTKNQEEDYGYRSDFVEEMNLTLIEKYGYEFFENGIYGYPPNQIEYFGIYLSFLNDKIGENYQKQHDTYLKICLAGADNSAEYRPEKPNYYDFDKEKFEKFLSDFGLNLDLVFINEPTDFDYVSISF